MAPPSCQTDVVASTRTFVITPSARRTVIVGTISVSSAATIVPSTICSLAGAAIDEVGAIMELGAVVVFIDEAAGADAELVAVVVFADEALGVSAAHAEALIAITAAAIAAMKRLILISSRNVAPCPIINEMLTSRLARPLPASSARRSSAWCPTSSKTVDDALGGEWPSWQS